MAHRCCSHSGESKSALNSWAAPSSTESSEGEIPKALRKTGSAADVFFSNLPWEGAGKLSPSPRHALKQSHLIRALSSQGSEGLWLLHRFYMFVVVRSRSDECQAYIQSVQATRKSFCPFGPPLLSITRKKEKEAKSSAQSTDGRPRRSGRRRCSLLFRSHRSGRRQSSLLFRSPREGRHVLFYPPP
jgi:hypothetical protein